MIPLTFASVIITALLIIVLMVLLYPLWHASKRPLLMGEASLLDETEISQTIEKGSITKTLEELEVDYAQGKLSTDDYQRLKLMEERRFLTLLAPMESAVATDPPCATTTGTNPKPWGLMLAISIWIIAGSVAISNWVYGKIAREQETAAGPSAPVPGMPAINPEEMVARLEKWLKDNPNDLNGQMMLGRSYMVLQRWEKAEATWKKVLELDERNPNAHASLGELLLRASPPGNKEAAEQSLVHFDKALISMPQNPSILWARGIALVGLGRFAEADEAWTAAYQTLTPGSSEANMIKQALDALRSGKIPSS